MSDELAIKIEHVSKQYHLGAIGGGTLKGDLQSWWARKRGREDPNSKIGDRTDIKMGDRFLALDDINLEVKKGEAVGIIGHNGAGKSTLLKLLSRVTAPTKGTIFLNGRIASMLEVGTGFHPELTGRENVYMNGAILGMTKAEIDKKLDEIVEFSEVAKFIDTPVKRYSSGMYVKLAFSVAAHLDSEIMIMDEVLAVGDMAFQRKCLSKMRSAAKDELIARRIRQMESATELRLRQPRKRRLIVLHPRSSRARSKRRLLDATNYARIKFREREAFAAEVFVECCQYGSVANFNVANSNADSRNPLHAASFIGNWN